MVTVHTVQAQFFVQQMVLCAVGLGFSTVLSKRRSVHEYVYPLIGI